MVIVGILVGVLAVSLVTLVGFCCLVLAKRADESMDRLHLRLSPHTPPEEVND